MQIPVLVVGGGLAGLTAARHFHLAGIAFLLLEARDRLGGRILTTDASGNISEDGFDLGPSWFWPGMHSATNYLVEDLSLSYFAQKNDGDMLFERTRTENSRRIPGMRQEPESMRFVGGTVSIVSALASGLPSASIRLNARVTHVTLKEGGVEVRWVDAVGAAHDVQAKHVLFTLPPRLLEATVRFSPALDAETAKNWRDTPTWMATHAKFCALYDRPFWYEAGLSGTGQSLVGPLVEIHDATTASGKAALFGFFGVSARQRASIGRDALVRAAVEQLVHMFGPQAGAPEATLFKDWSADPFTATEDDRNGGGHPGSGGLSPVPHEWHGRVLLGGTEAGRREAGYLAGAIEAADNAVMNIMNQFEIAR